MWQKAVPQVFYAKKNIYILIVLSFSSISPQILTFVDFWDFFCLGPVQLHEL